MGRKIAIAIIAGLFAFQTAGAQNLTDLLKLFGFGSSDTTEQAAESAEAAKTPELTSEGLLGVWRYVEPASRYDGNDMLGSVGFKAMQAVLPAMYAKAGLSDGSARITFSAPDVASGEIGKYKVTGRYTFTPEDGSMSVSATVGKASGVLHGTATLEDGVLTLLFDAAEAAAIVERVSAKAAANDNFKMMKSLLDSYPGVKLGCRMRR